MWSVLSSCFIQTSSADPGRSDDMKMLRYTDQILDSSGKCFYCFCNCGVHNVPVVM